MFLSLVQFGKGDNNNNNNTDDCGDLTTWTDDYKDNFNTSEVGADPTIRTLYYENVATPENICAQGAAVASYLVKFNSSGKPADILEITGKAYWGLGDKSLSTLRVSNSSVPNQYYVKSGGLDLEPFFGILPGWIGLSLIFTVNSQGSLEADRALVESSIESTNVQFVYHVVQ